MDAARPTMDFDRQNHGGVAAVISDALDYRQLPAPFNPTTFESVAFTVGILDSTAAVLLIYRPGSSAVTDAFFTELTTIWSYLHSINVRFLWQEILTFMLRWQKMPMQFDCAIFSRVLIAFNKCR